MNEVFEGIITGKQIRKAIKALKRVKMKPQDILFYGYCDNHKMIHAIRKECFTNLSGDNQ